MKTPLLSRSCDCTSISLRTMVNFAKPVPGTTTGRAFKPGESPMMALMWLTVVCARTSGGVSGSGSQRNAKTPTRVSQNSGFVLGQVACARTGCLPTTCRASSSRRERIFDGRGCRCRCRSGGKLDGHRFAALIEIGLQWHETKVGGARMSAVAKMWLKCEHKG